MSEYHNPVLLNESVSALITNSAGTYVDATFGGGGHSAEILKRLSDKGRLISFDKDKDALDNSIADSRFQLIHNDFRFIHNYVLLNGFQNGSEAKVDGILADLGVSSHQFDTAERGFSFRFDAPLDMRMNSSSKLSAEDVVNGYEKEDLARLLWLWGELDNSRRLAELILHAREASAIKTTSELNAALAPALPPYAEHKVLAKIYQALRIEVNGEMRSLEKLLDGAAESLKAGGRLVVITYHSLEDRMVKNYIKTGNIDGELQKDSFGRVISPFKAVNRKPILPDDAEITENTRARSAKLRIAEKQ